MADVQGLFPTKIGSGDNSGDYVLVTTRNGLTIEGVQADGAAVAANPILIGGQDGTNVQSFNVDSTGRQVIVGAAADGAAVAGNPVLIAGSDGANAQSLTVDTTGRQVIVGAAANGAAASGNPVLIAGADGSNNVQTLRVDSTGNLTLGGVSDTTATGTITALNGTVSLNFEGRKGVAVVLSGTWTATIEGQVSSDGGITWISTDLYSVDNDIFVSSTTTNGTFIFPVLAGMSDVRVTATAFTSGTVTANLRANNTDFDLLGAEGENGGSVPLRSLQIGATDGSNFRALRSDTSGRQIIVGAAADGAAVAGNPVLIGGSDGTNAQSISVDTTGRQVIVGAAADGAAVDGNPVLIAGTDGTNAQSLSVDSTGRQVIVGAAADGAAVTGNPVLMAGSDGTNAETLLTDSAGRLNIVGAAADGAAVAGNPVLIAGSDGTNAETILTDSSGRLQINSNEQTTNLVHSYSTVSSVANNTTGTVTYTTSVGVTFLFKQFIASASAGPCKVVVDYGAVPTVLFTGFFSDAIPVLSITFDQPVAIPASTAVNIKIINRAGRAQDVYGTIIGREI